MMRRRGFTAGQWAAVALGVALFLGFAGWLYGGSYMRQREAALSRASNSARLMAGHGGPSTFDSAARLSAASRWRM
jgi:hypothetical protein